MRVTRRGLLIGAGLSGGLLLGWGLTPRRFEPPLTPAPGETGFGAWLTIGKDGVITVAVPQLEMGQGITTLLPQVVAMELGADWRQIAVVSAPLSGAYPNVPLAAAWAEQWLPIVHWLATAPDALLARRYAESSAFMATADGLSLAAYEQRARIAAASARALLCMAAAKEWGLGWEECAAANGFVTHGKQRLPFGELAGPAAEFDPPDPPVLRPAPPSERASAIPAGGKLAFPRLDLPAKVDGSAQFAADIRLPGMQFAAIHHAPIGRAALSEFDATKAKDLPGFLGLVERPDWLAALGSDWWAAERALKEIAPSFDVSHRADSTLIAGRMDEALVYGDETVIHSSGDLPDKWTVALRYDIAPALHGTLETAAVTARFADGKLELWTATQDPAAARRTAANALGISTAEVVLYPMSAGGSFDRRLEHEPVAEVAIIARETGKPVQLIWSRWQEHLAGLPRTPVAAMMAAQTTPAGDIAAWKARLVLPAVANEFGQRLFGGKTAQAAMDGAAGESDAMALAGAVPAYALPAVVVQHVPVETLLPAGRMRGQAHGYTAFLTECFIDELAARAGREPMSYRMALLGQETRLAQCLQRAAALASWNGGKDGSGQGIACHRMTAHERWGGIAAVATARRDEHGVRVDKLHCVADIGRIVNVDIARQQIEGGLVFGLALALGSATAYAEGLPLNGRLRQLNLPTLATCPEIEVEFVESDLPPLDPGELGVAVVAPAVANALFSATGLRFRTLPLGEPAT